MLASIDLHPDTFQPGNSTQTSVLVLERKRFDEIELERAAGRKKDYEVFMALANHIGHDKRGNTTFVRDEDGNEIVVSKEERIRDVRQGTPVYRTVEVKEKVKDDNTQQIAEDLPGMADSVMTASAARLLPRMRSLTPQCGTLPLSEVAAGDRRLDAEVYLSRWIHRPSCDPGLWACGIAARPTRANLAAESPEGHSSGNRSTVHRFSRLPRYSTSGLRPGSGWRPARRPGIADRYVSPGWILVTCSGTVGNVILSYSAHADIWSSRTISCASRSRTTLRCGVTCTRSFARGSRER